MRQVTLSFASVLPPRYSRDRNSSQCQIDYVGHGQLLEVIGIPSCTSMLRALRKEVSRKCGQAALAIRISRYERSVKLAIEIVRIDANVRYRSWRRKKDNSYVTRCCSSLDSGTCKIFHLPWLSLNLSTSSFVVLIIPTHPGESEWQHIDTG